MKEIKYNSHEEWLAIRRHFIGGSDAGAIVGMNPYKSRYTLWAEKTGKLPEFEGNVITKVGSFLEQLVADMFCEETKKKVRRNNRILISAQYPWASANLDREIVGEDAILECKTTNSPLNLKKFKNGEYPETWYCQVMHYLAVTGKKKAYIAVLISCRDFQIFEVDRDEEEIAALMSAEKDFWHLVVENIMPEIDGSSSSSEALSIMYPESNGEGIDLTLYDTSLGKIVEIDEQIKQLKDIRESYANKIKEHMKDAAKGESARYKVSYASSERNTFDTKKFVSDHKEMDLTNYYNTTTYRTFRITEKK